MRLLILAMGAGACLAQDWPQFRGNPRLTGIAASPAPKPPLKVLWTWEAGDSIESSAAVADGRL